MNSRERFRETMRCGAPDRVPYFDEGIRDEVFDVWQKRGLKKETDLFEMFDLDLREEIEVDVDPLPRFQRWPSSTSDLEAFNRHLDPSNPSRMPEGFPGRLHSLREKGQTLILRVHRGFFLSFGVYDCRRFNEVMFLTRDDPKFVRETMAIQGQFAAKLAEKVLREVEIDAILFGEPISGNDRALISPAMYEEFVLSSYQPILDVAKRCGVKTIILRTYGNSRVLLPSAVHWGFNCLWASEVNREAMDYRSIRREFGRELRLIGGIDLDALRYGKKAIQREVREKVPPLLADGGYIPLLDGRVRKDVSFENYSVYRQLLKEMTNP